MYDTRIRNPFNPDTRPVTLRELRSYCSGCEYESKTLTLLTQLGRRVGKYSMALCNMLAACPLSPDT